MKEDSPTNLDDSSLEDALHTIPTTEIVDFYNERATELEEAQQMLQTEMAMSMGDNLSVAEKLAEANLKGRLDEVRALEAYLRTRNLSFDPDTLFQ